MYSEASDQTKQLDQLLASIKTGDTDALAALYRLCSTAVYAYSFSILKNNEDAEDVLQDCFISIFENAHRYHSTGKPMAWILTIAKNLCLQNLRQRKKAEPLSQEDWRGCMDACTEMTADDKVVLQQCMEKLSDDERQIVVLHAVSGFKHREIAALMDLALPTVLSKYHRAIKKMKAYL